MTATQPISDPRTGAVRDLIARRPTMLAALACLVSFTGFWIAQRAAHVSMIDLMVYRAEGWTMRTGRDLYAMVATEANLPNTYPPFAAIIFAPLTWLGVPAMRTAATAANLGLLVAVVHLSLRLVGRPQRVPRTAATLAISAVAVWCEPVWTTLRYGQINLLLAVLVLWDLTRRADHRWAGTGIGIAAGIKLTPALFAVFLALVGAAQGWRRLRGGGRVWNPALRRAAVAAGAFAATVTVAAVALPRDSRDFWTRMVFAANRVGHAEETANQSVRGVLARLLHTPDPGGSWLVAAALVGALGLAVAVAAALAGDRLPSGTAWAACACAVTALLVSPVSWSHHWVWCVPMVLLLGSEALRRRDPRWRVGAALTAVLFCSFVPWAVPHTPGRRFELHQNPGEMLLSAVYPLIGLAFLAVAGTQAVRALRIRREALRAVIPAQSRGTRQDQAYADR
ncbi:glycosyltransferase 87 family protein [Streptomyces silvisoli]|uniref:Glycosyltransferase 87 family protein n=1 Tax=Streptomyces silvisoli TaxID=3034235 RepID=A0ABT5ZEH0_9ACTN|nr:glycosyltransferase 87 family protein [Streptomyces silvisoli]MDF3288228.1 glycosyltransferase 87 family protein [Streptomyces silvisoli]